MTTLTITPTAAVDCKHAVLVGCVAVREYVSVTLVGLGSRVSEGLVLRVLRGSTPLASCEQWVASGTLGVNATGTLNLNTEELVAFMAGTRAGNHKALDLALWSIQAQEFIISESIDVLANRMDPAESAPVPLSPWGTDLTTIRADIDAVEAAILAHDHDGTDAAKVSHANLLGIGVNSHAAIDTALATLQADVNAHAGRLAALEAWRIVATGLLSSAADTLAVISQWKASATADLGALQVTSGNLFAQMGALQALAPADLGWSAGPGDELRGMTAAPSYGDLLKVVRTLVADLKTRGVI